MAVLVTLANVNPITVVATQAPGAYAPTFVAVAPIALDVFTVNVLAIFSPYPNAIENANMLSFVSFIAAATVLAVVPVSPFNSNVPL